MFLGQHQSSFEADNRLAVPARFRDLLAQGAYITQGFDRNLLVLSADAFQAIYARFTALNIADPLARLLLRMILGSATELEIDASGHMLVPSKLREFAGLEADAVLVGQGEYIEVWTPGAWQQQELRLQDVEANAGRFAGLVLTA
jgi:MraZ protein